MITFGQFFVILGEIGFLLFGILAFKIPNNYLFDKDLKNEKLRLYVNTSGPTVFEGTDVAKKMKAKYNVTVCSSYSCYSDNTDYDSRYALAVSNYLDEQFGTKWRKQLKKYGLTPWK